MKRRFLCIVLAVATALSFGGCSSKSPRVASPITDETTLAISIYAFNGVSERVFGIPNLGHAFVSVKNLTSTPLFIGEYELLAGEEVTIGTWGQNAHWGIWYNLEAHYMTLGRYKGVVSITRALESGKLEAIASYLENSDYWTPFTNCSAFALALWNTVSEDDNINLVGLITPTKLGNEIKRFTTYQTNRMLTPVQLPSFLDNSQLVYAKLAKEAV